MIIARSELTKKLLNCYFLNPEQSLYVNELARKLGVDKRNLVKKIREFEQEGLLKSQHRGNLKLYSLNNKYPLMNEYKRIFLKTTGFEKVLEKILKEVGGVKRAYIYGSYAKDTMGVHSDIDILVVGQHSIVDLQKQIADLQRTIDREINVVSMSEADFKKRLDNKEPYLKEILSKKHIKVIG